jgi:hypothetical protein
MFIRWRRRTGAWVEVFVAVITSPATLHAKRQALLPNFLCLMPDA